MTRIFSGTATVTNGDATVTIAAGDPLTAANCPTDAPVMLDGVGYHVASRTDTTSFELLRAYEGSTGTVAIEIDPLTPDALSVVNIAVLVARVQAQLNVLDKNSQGLFYNRAGVTGDTDPAPGNLAFDNADPTLVTEFYIDNLDGNQRSVTGLLDLWTAGTVVLVRSLATTAYVAYRLPSGVEAHGGYYSAGTEYVDHDGVLADGEAVSIGWFRVGEGLDINASGTLAGRAAYDDEDAGFVYVTDDGDLYRKNSATSGDWGPAVPLKGVAGDKGWAPRFAVIADGERRVMQLAGYVGGTGDAPTANIGQYVSTGGYTATIGSATDIRGGIGLSAYEVAVLGGFVGDATAWLASLVGLSAYQVALANGYVGDAASWLLSLRGLDGTDPGVLMIWDDGTTDADPGAGTLRADNALTTSAAFLYVSKTNRPGDDISVFLASLADSNSNRKGVITLTRSGGDAQATFDITGITDATGYVKVAVANGSGATFLDNDIVSFQFAPAGDRGTDGLGAGNFVTEFEPAIDPTGYLVSFADDSGVAGANSGILVSDVPLKSNNGTDFGSRKATLDNLHLNGADIASAATVNLETATGWFVEVTGTTTTTAITLSDGHPRLVRAGGAWPITHSTNLQLQGGASYTCTAGDWVLFVADGTVIRAMIIPIAGNLPANDSITNAKLANMATATIKGRSTAGTGDPEDLTIAQVRGLLGDASAGRDRMVNGAMQISEENGNAAGTSSGYYAADQWATYKVHSAGTITSQRVQARTPAGGTDRYRVTITAADTSLAAGEYLTITQNLEGLNVADYLYGTASAEASVLRFGFKGPAGTYAVSLRNSANNRCIVIPFTIAGGAANTDTIQEVAILGDTSGTWLTAEGVIGITMDIVLAAGSTFQTATVNAWQAGNYMGSTAISNGMGTVSAVFELFDVGFKLDFDGTGEYGPYEVPYAPFEKMKCRRFWREDLNGIGRWSTTTTFVMVATWDVAWCKNPTAGTPIGTITEPGVANRAVTGVSVAPLAETGYTIFTTAAATNGAVGYAVSSVLTVPLSARL